MLRIDSRIEEIGLALEKLEAGVSLTPHFFTFVLSISSGAKNDEIVNG